jgi:hypothetical protein
VALPPNLITGVTAKIRMEERTPLTEQHFPKKGTPPIRSGPRMWTLAIPGWMPTPLNQLMGHHGKRHRLKTKDKQVLGVPILLYGIPPAIGKRRVSVLVVLPKGKRAVDPDALWKSLLDALQEHRVLTTDSRHGVELGPVSFARGDELCTFVTIEEAE